MKKQTQPYSIEALGEMIGVCIAMIFAAPVAILIPIFGAIYSIVYLVLLPFGIELPTGPDYFGQRRRW